jgi:hypothetical protein
MQGGIFLRVEAERDHHLERGQPPGCAMAA